MLTAYSEGNGFKSHRLEDWPFCQKFTSVHPGRYRSSPKTSPCISYNAETRTASLNTRSRKSTPARDTPVHIPLSIVLCCSVTHFCAVYVATLTVWANPT